MKAKNDITLHTEEELASESMAWITDHHNKVVNALGLKSVKKFRDKATAISRTLSAQEDYNEELIEAVKSAAKESKKTSKQNSETFIKTNKLGLTASSIIGYKGIPFKGKVNSRMNTIEDTIILCLVKSYAADLEEFTLTLEELVHEVMHTHKRPRSSGAVDKQYVIHNIKWFLKKGRLTIEN